MFPATTHASKDTPKEERRRVPSYDKSIQGHPRRKKVKRGKKERKKERKTDRQTDRKKERKTERKKERGRERERKGEERKEKGRCSQLRTVVQGHTKERKG